MMKIERLFDIPYYQLEQHPLDIMFSTKRDQKWEGISTKEFLDKANLISRGLIALGVQPGDKIALVSANRVEWNIMDIGIQQTGAIGVPIYPNISVKDYKYIFNDAGIKLCVTGDEELYNKINGIKSELPLLDKIYCFDQLNGAPFWEEIMAEADKTDVSEIDNRKAAIQNGDLATMIYTSGTTGNPKGVMLSHNNILSNVKDCRPRVPGVTGNRALTFLPVCHVYERMLHYLYMYVGFSIYFAESIDTIGENIKEVKPHVFSAAPRLLEKVYDKIVAKGDELKGFKRNLFFWAISLGEQYEFTGKSLGYKIKLAIANKLIFSKWREALGGELLAVVSGSASLSPRLARIFTAGGVPVLEGYGLTETSPVISVNSLEKGGAMFGSVGTLIDNVEVKFAEDGEIIVRGPNIMMGYYNQPEKTKEVLEDDGWFHTGDIGELVQGKFLKITDRKKEIFKTSGGKYIIPQVMENTFKQSRFIEQIMVIGEGKKHPAALIVPSYAFVKDWAERKGIDVGSDNASLISNQQVIERIGEEVANFNQEFGHWEQIKKFELLPKEFSIEGNELTPTLKFKRNNILEIYKDLVDKIYAE
ncbi:MAG: long-chain fatty acid--CoA ligase [Brumimicrobium sp.]|nr:long-chain fatty acid--CoA ligase [Brumimicrobium sp.]